MQYLDKKSIIVFVLAVIFLSIFLLCPSWQIGGDGYGYYSYLRSFYFDRDLDFHNEMEQYDNLYGTKILESRVTDTDKIGNPFAIGWSIFYAPFFVLALILDKFFTFSNNFALSGFNFPYKMLIGVGTLFYVILGILLIFSTLKRFFSGFSAWFSAFFTLIATPLIYYVIYEPSMSHGLSFFIVSLLVYKTIQVYKTKKISKKDVFLLGLITGLCFLVRWQNLIFIVLPVAVLWLKLAKKIRVLSYLGIFLITILPQFLVWKHLYGSFFIIPQGREFVYHKLEFFNFLFSGYHGLFIWHPILILGVIGLILSYRKEKFIFLALTVPLIGQIIFNSGLSDWFGGSSFGSRRMISSLPIFAYGLAYLLDLIFNKNKKNYIYITISILFLAGIWNYLLMISTARGILPIKKSVTVQEVYIAPIKLFNS